MKKQKNKSESKNGAAVIDEPKDQLEPVENRGVDSAEQAEDQGRESSTESQERNREVIEKRAYEIYESRGREDGRALEDWLQAEEEISNRI